MAVKVTIWLFHCFIATEPTARCAWQCHVISPYLLLDFDVSLVSLLGKVSILQGEQRGNVKLQWRLSECLLLKRVFQFINGSKKRRDSISDDLRLFKPCASRAFANIEQMFEMTVENTDLRFQVVSEHW